MTNAKDEDAEREDVTGEQAGAKGEVAAVSLPSQIAGYAAAKAGVVDIAVPAEKGIVQATSSKAMEAKSASVDDANATVEASGAAKIQPAVVAGEPAKEMEKQETSSASGSFSAGGSVETTAAELGSQAPSTGVGVQRSALGDRLSAKRAGDGAMDAPSNSVKAKRGRAENESRKSGQDGNNPVAAVPVAAVAGTVVVAAVAVATNALAGAAVVAPAETSAGGSSTTSKAALSMGARGRAAIAGEAEKDSAKNSAVTSNEVVGDDATVAALPVAAVTALQQAGIAVGHAVAAGSGSTDSQVSQVGPVGVGAAVVSSVGHAGAVHAGAEIQSRALDAGTYAQSAGAQGPQLIAAGPTRLEVGTLDGTHGWVQVRAELGTGGDVRASLTGSAAAHEALRAAVPGLAGYLHTEAVSVSGIAVHRAASGSGTGLMQNAGGASAGAQSGRGQGQGGDSGGAAKNSSAASGYGSRSEASQIVGAASALSDVDATAGIAAARFADGGLPGFTGGDSGNWVSVTV
jgi:hypothetical protein